MGKDARHRFKKSSDSDLRENEQNRVSSHRRPARDSKRHGVEVEKRKKRKQLLKYRNTVCFSCRRKGHPINLCPKQDSSESSISICYKCGSKEHKIQNCAVKVDPKNPFPFAQCFVCNGTGHISRDCPENEKGVYINGGSCIYCDSVNHLAQECPNKPLTQKQRKHKERQLARKQELDSFVGVTDDSRQAGDDDQYLADSRIASNESGVLSRDKKPRLNVVQF